MSSNASTSTGTRKRGFGSMDPDRQKQIARQGGKAAHARGSAHEFTSDEARQAGRKGGVAVSQNRQHMAEIGRRGGEARGVAHARRRAQQQTGGESTQTSSEDTSSSESPMPLESEQKIRVTGDVEGIAVEGEVDTRPQTTPPPGEATAEVDENRHRQAS